LPLRVAANTSELPPDQTPRMTGTRGDMDWLLYAVLVIGLIVVVMRLGAWLLFKHDGNRD